MDLVLKDGIWILNINMIQSLALAVITYYLGVWVKTKVSVLDRLSMPSPVVGGMIFAVILSVLQAAGILIVHFDSTLQTLLMLAFFTTIGMMASVKVVKQGGKLLVGCGGVLADADDHHAPLLEYAIGCGEGAGLAGAAGGVVPGIEIQHHLLAPEVGQAVDLALGVGQGEVGCEGIFTEHERCLLLCG